MRSTAAVTLVLKDSVPKELDMIEFLDPSISNENEMMVSEYFEIPCTNLETTVNGKHPCSEGTSGQIGEGFSLGGSAPAPGRRYVGYRSHLASFSKPKIRGLGIIGDEVFVDGGVLVKASKAKPQLEIDPRSPKVGRRSGGCRSGLRSMTLASTKKAPSMIEVEREEAWTVSK
ncbi:hypothetical protein RHMOL_Rhmol06G0242100 [Rhododendron molle]|uniref:Uncharacterized protein n=1 Tax=Rhododendron molle TaxID=49168 RepID=A0ACC0NI32_RHOML|nr:hypothetical protein RHMOL_Rhmol06G0242100 [Rhododendron molle]